MQCGSLYFLATVKQKLLFLLSKENILGTCQKGTSGKIRNGVLYTVDSGRRGSYQQCLFWFIVIAFQLFPRIPVSFHLWSKTKLKQFGEESEVLPSKKSVHALGEVPCLPSRGAFFPRDAGQERGLQSEKSQSSHEWLGVQGSPHQARRS